MMFSGKTKKESIFIFLRVIRYICVPIDIFVISDFVLSWIPSAMMMILINLLLTYLIAG